MLRLYFLRHGRALARADWQGDDALRPLTPEGQELMRREAAGMRALHLGLEAVVTSPLTRARQTADLVARALGDVPLLEDARLAHGFDARALARVVRDVAPRRALMLVGHEPEFSATIGRLIGGGRVVCKKGGLARVDAADDRLTRGELVWLLAPSQLAAMAPGGAVG